MAIELQAGLSKEKLDLIREKLERRNASFSNKKFLDSMSLPSGIIGRENEAIRILENLYDLKKGYAVPFVSVYGKSGTGKSSVVNFVCESMSDISCTAFVNLRRSKTVFNCANSILLELGGMSLKSADGMSKVLDLIEQRIEEILISEKKKFFILMLDEFDVIFQDRRSDPSDFVFKLLTVEENLRKRDLWLCIVSISNNSLASYDLEDRVRSRIGMAEVMFPPYTKSEIFQILKDRVSQGLASVIPDDVILACAEKSSMQHGDCRKALDLLRNAIEVAGQHELTREHLEEAEKDLGRDGLQDYIWYATPHQRAILASLCVLTLFSEKSHHTTSRIFSQYEKIAINEDKPLSYRRFYDLLSELEGAGLVVRKTRSRGRYGYASEWTLSTDEHMVGNALNPAWWDDRLYFKGMDVRAKERLREATKSTKRC